MLISVRFAQKLQFLSPHNAIISFCPNNSQKEPIPNPMCFNFISRYNILYIFFRRTLLDYLRTRHPNKVANILYSLLGVKY